MPFYDPAKELSQPRTSAPDPFGRLGDDEDTEIKDIKNPTQLSAPVGETGVNARRDVAKVEKALGKAGTLDLKKTDGPTGYWGMRTADATKAFQKQNGLKVDGQINPHGETMQKLAQTFGAAMTKAAPSKQVRRGDDTGVGLGTLPQISDAAYAANARTARYLANRADIGDTAKFVADGIETDGDKAIAEVIDLIDQLRGRNPKQADMLIEKVLPGLSPVNEQRLTQTIKPMSDAADADRPLLHKTAAPAALPWILGAGALGAGAAQQTMQHPPKLPNREEFPAQDGEPDDGVVNGRPAEPDRVIDPPPFVPPHTGEDLATPPLPDQSDDPDVNGPQVLDYTPLDIPVNLEDGDDIPDKVKERLESDTIADPARREFQKNAMSIGVMTAAGKGGANIQTALSPDDLDAYYEDIVRQHGGDPKKPVATNKNVRVFTSPDGVLYKVRPSSTGPRTLEVRLPEKGVDINKGLAMEIRARTPEK